MITHNEQKKIKELQSRNLIIYDCFGKVSGTIKNINRHSCMIIEKPIVDGENSPYGYTTRTYIRKDRFISEILHTGCSSIGNRTYLLE